MKNFKEQLETLKTLVSIIALLVALGQMIFSNSRRAAEHLETRAEIMELTERVEIQQQMVEAALR